MAFGGNLNHIGDTSEQNFTTTSPQNVFWPPAFDAAVFDFDGTIAYSGDIWIEVDKQFLAQRGLPYTREFTVELATLGFEDGAQFVIDTYHLDEDPQAICDEWNRVGEQLYRERVTLRAGAADYIQALRAKGIPCALATTNSPNVIDALKPRVDADALFDVRVHGCDVKRNKHFPDIYIEAARRLGTPCERCIVFEDILPGLSAAMSTGMTGCGVKSNDPTQDEAALHAKADFWIRDWTDLILR